jgi:asparagine synthase (glutamine-hydrolysing)
MTHVDRELAHRLCTPEFIAASGDLDPVDDFRSWYAQSDANNTLDATLDVDLHTYLPDDLLVKVDIASMAHGLEVRSPLLDHELVEFAASLPPSLKLRGNVSKYLLRSVAQSLLPAEVLRRPKMGFGVPLDMWFRKDLREFVRDVLTSPSARQRGCFRPDAIERLIAEHESSRRTHHHLLWSLVVFELWHRMFVDVRPSGPADAPRLAPVEVLS